MLLCIIDSQNRLGCSIKASELKWSGSSVVEQWTENPRVSGSIPFLTTIKIVTKRSFSYNAYIYIKQRRV